MERIENVVDTGDWNHSQHHLGFEGEFLGLINKPNFKLHHLSAQNPRGSRAVPLAVLQL